MAAQKPLMFGIRNCDTVKKARAWLESKGIDYAFHDLKSSGVTAEQLRLWCGELGWEQVINRAGTTFRKLPDHLKEGLDGDRAVALMLEQPSMIRRPVLDFGGRKIICGFKPERYAGLFGNGR